MVYLVHKGWIWVEQLLSKQLQKKHYSKETGIIEETLFDKLKDTVENNVEAMDQLYDKFIRQMKI